MTETRYQPKSNPPTLQLNGIVTIGPINIGVWAELDGIYRFVPIDSAVKSFTIKGEGKFIKRIKEVYGD